MSDERHDSAAQEPAGFFPNRPIWTPEIERKAIVVADWVTCELEGGHIWGIQRVGKSEFAKYLEHALPSMLGVPTAVFIFEFLLVKPKTAETLLRKCLLGLESNAVGGKELMTMYGRLLGLIVARCRAIGAKRAVLIVDEMQNIPHELYPVFMSLASDVRKAGMVTHVLSIGQPEMKATIDLVFQSNYLQTIGRFFQGMEVYHGLTLEDVSALLANMEGEGLEFTTRHFPQRAQQGWSITELAKPIGDAVGSLLAEDNIKAAARLPFAYLRPALNTMFLDLASAPHVMIDATKAVEAMKKASLHKVLRHYVVR
mgnify:CR=1 FL=1